MIKRLTNRFRDDAGLMSQSMLIGIMIPAILGAVIAALLMNMQVDRAREMTAVNKQAADQLASLILSDLNDGYPTEYLSMSALNLRKATTLISPTTGAQAYVSVFTADTGVLAENWTYIRITSQASKNAISAQDFTYKYRASTSIGYLGKNENGRPIWAPRPSNGFPSLAIFELVPESADKAKYPAAPWEIGQRPTEVLNPRIIRSVQYGVILVWNQPANAGPSELNGYELASQEPGATGDCAWQKQNPGAFTGADGFIILNPDLRADKINWACNSNPAGSSMSIRGSSPNGLGTNLIVKLNDLTVTSDLFPPTPVAVKNLALGTITQTGSTASWDATTCDARSHPEYQFIWTKGNSGSSAWQKELTYRTTHPMGTELTFVISAKCVGEYNDSPTVESAPFSFIAPTDPATNLRVVTRNASSVDVTWNPVSCPIGTTAKYRATFNSLNNISFYTSIWDVATTSSVTTKFGDGFRWSVESRCDSTTTSAQSQAIASPQVVLMVAPATPTSLGTVGPPGATQTTLTFSAVTCTPGATIEYLVSVTGNAPFTTTSTTPLITNPTGVSSADWKVEARCTYGSEASPYSVAANGTIILTVQVPTTPTNLTANDTNKVASWTASTCPTPGSTPNYQFEWISGASGISSWFTIPSYTHGVATQGVDLIWKVNVKCVITGSNPIRESAVVSSAPGPKFFNVVTAPTGTWFQSTTNNVSTVSPAAKDDIVCGPGATLQERVVRTRHGNDYGIYYSAWGAPGATGVPGSNWEGWRINVNTEARCIAGANTSTSISSSMIEWVRGISTPASVGGLYLRNGPPSNSLGWSGVGCNPGNYAYYAANFWDDGGAFNYWYGTTDNYWNRPLVNSSSYTFHYTVQSKCVSSDPSLSPQPESPYSGIAGMLNW